MMEHEKRKGNTSTNINININTNTNTKNTKRNIKNIKEKRTTKEIKIKNFPDHRKDDLEADHVMKIKGGRNHLDIRKKGCIQKEEVVQEVETEVEVVPETEDGTEVTLKVEAAQREGGLILVEKRVPPGEVAPEQE